MKVNVNVSSGATPADNATTSDMMPPAVPAPAPAPEPVPEPVAEVAPDPVATVSVDPVVPTPKQRRLPKLPISKKALIIISVMGVIAVVVLLSLQYVSAKRKLSQAQNPQEAAKTEADNLVKQVAKLAALPNGETPTVATVVDASKLKAQAFFASAENGDKVLMYTTAKKAYLYRPGSNQIIEIAPINLGEPAAPAPAPTPPPAPKKR